jgi:hypothetical protein
MVFFGGQIWIRTWLSHRSSFLKAIKQLLDSKKGHFLGNAEAAIS